MASHLLGEPLKEKITSAEIFSAFCAHHQTNEDMRLFIDWREVISRLLHAAKE